MQPADLIHKKKCGTLKHLLWVAYFISEEHVKIFQRLDLVHVNSISSLSPAIFLNQLLFSMNFSTCLIKTVAVTSGLTLKYSEKKLSGDVSVQARVLSEQLSFIIVH